MASDDFVRNDQNKRDKDLYTFKSALSNAYQGVWDTISGERNLKIDLVVAVCVVLLGFLFRLPSDCWLAIVLCIGLVVSLETANTSIEAVVDMVSPEYHLLAKKAKDCAAGAVLIAAITSVVVGLIIFVPRILLLM